MSLLTGKAQKILFTFFSLFFFLYNGYGISFVNGVHPNYHYYYCGFYLAFSTGYLTFLRIFYTPFKILRKKTDVYIKQLALSPKVAIISISIFLLISIVPLIYPTNRIFLLLNPPKPDVGTQFFATFTNNINPVIKIFENIGYLIYPFYLISLYYFRKKPLTLAFILFFPLYLHYCNISYINRAYVLERLVIFGTMLYSFYPSIRKILIIGSLIIIPFMVIFMVQYQDIRGGNKAQKISFVDASKIIFNAETSFPVFSNKIINSDKHINLKDYFVWIITLPIPKVIIGKINPVSAGAEMSEILLGKKQGDEGYFALLAGLLTESVYTFGQKWYFLHAIFISLLMAIIVRFVEKTIVLSPMVLVFTILFSYTLNRAGISGMLPSIINQFLFYYLLIFLLYFRKISLAQVK